MTSSHINSEWRYIRVGMGLYRDGVTVGSGWYLVIMKNLHFSDRI